MARALLREVVFGLAATGLLMGCVAGGGSTPDSGNAGSVAAPGKKAGAQDVEAPEVFQTTDSALWDGRPSLGGIWVAAPEVTNPERALMFNPATGKSVTGALFRRERDNPGPRLQLSSDAAEALGILAGQPTEIKVTALRKQEVAEPAETEAADPTSGDAATADADPAGGSDGDAAAIASAALAAVDAEQAPSDAAAQTDPAPQDGDAATAAAAGTAAVAAAAADGTATVVDEKPRRKTWKERRAEAKAAREAKKKAAADAKAAAAGTTALAEGEVPTASPDAAAAAIAPIESAPLDARTPEAIAPTETGTPRKTADAAPAATETAAAPAPETPAATGPARPIQVASFSKEENAKRAAEALAKIGVTATPQKSETNGKAVWGVVVMGDDAMLKKIKDAGFADAYYLK